jgi:hypothetical protein
MKGIEFGLYSQQQKRLIRHNFPKPIYHPNPLIMQKHNIDDKTHYVSIPKEEYEKLMRLNEDYEKEISEPVKKMAEELSRREEEWLKADRKRYDIQISLKERNVELLHQKIELKRELDRLKNKKWYQFWK